MVPGFNSEKESPVAKAVRWIIPSVTDLIFLIFVGVLCFTSLSVRLLGDAGIGWHIRTGQLIFSSHAIPHIDPFSSSMAGKPWFAWEWLYDLVVGWLDRAVGLNGVVLLTAIVIALTFSWAFRLLLRRGTNLIVALILMLLAASASMIHFLARPHVVSWLFSLTWFWVLDSCQRENSCSPAETRQHRRLLWLLPLSMLVWVNIHGGFLLGFVLLGIFGVSAIWQWLRTGEEKFEDVLQKIAAGKRIRGLALTASACTLATFVNPYGWKLHLHIYRYLSNRFLMDHIEEFQSPNFHGVAQKCFVALLLITLVALARGKRAYSSSSVTDSSVTDALIVLFAVYSGLYASRNLPVSALLLVLVIGPKLSDELRNLTRKSNKLGFLVTESRTDTSPPFLVRMQSIDSSLRGHLWPFAGALLTCWIVFHGGKLGGRQMMDAHFDGKRFPVAAIDYLEGRNVTSPIFAPDSWGGYLIYRLYPLYPYDKVVVDDRHDFYGEKFLTSYLKTIHVEPDWENFLTGNNVRCIVVPKSSALRSVLLESPQWQRVYSDDTASVFEPAETIQTSSLPQAP